MPESTLNAALRQFEAVEANLNKAERLLNALMAEVPQGISFGTTPEYDQNWRDFHDLINTLPKIDGWKAEIEVMDLDEIGQARLDASELGEIEYTISLEQRIHAPPKQLGEYRHRFNKKRRVLVRDAVTGLVDRIEERLRTLALTLPLFVGVLSPRITRPFYAVPRTSVAHIASG